MQNDIDVTILSRISIFDIVIDVIISTPKLTHCYLIFIFLWKINLIISLNNIIIIFLYNIK